MLDAESFLLGMAAGGGGGGGNPNYVETVQGTLANLLPDGGWSGLVTDILNNNATASATVSLGDQRGVFNIVKNSLSSGVYGVGSALTLVLADSSAMSVMWDNDGEAVSVLILQNGAVQDMTAMAEYFQTTLTIIHHPMP